MTTEQMLVHKLYNGSIEVGSFVDKVCEWCNPYYDNQNQKEYGEEIDEFESFFS